MSLISGVAKGGPGVAQALPNLNACCALPPKLQKSRYSNRTVKILLKQSAGQVVPCKLTQSGYATEFNWLVHKSSLMSPDHSIVGAYNRNIDKCLAHDMVWLYETMSCTVLVNIP